MNTTEMADSLLDKAYANLLDALDDLLPAVVAGLPAPSVSLVSASEKAVGVGNRIVDETRGPLPAIAMKGQRLDAVVRFQLWAATPDAVELLTEELQQRVQTEREQLRKAGFIATNPKAALLIASFLRLLVENTSLPEHIASPDSWRQSSTYRVLYEFRDRDDDGADSLIARIPINFTGGFNENTVVTDDLVRWDKIEAPALETRRRGRRVKQISSLVIFAFLPAGFDGDGVTVKVSIGGVTKQKSFASLRAFHDAFDLEAGTPERPLAELGGNQYHAGLMKFPNTGFPDFPDPILLTRGDDAMEISYASPSLGAGNDAVVYLRVI
jgi:hypothetical protein